MKFTKSKKEPKKSPEEAYAEHISSLGENELRDLHKDLKIDHYGNSTAAVINTAAGVGLLSMRSTIRRNRTECMQIEVMEARMKEMGWTPHPNRYRDAVPIALGVAAGTTSGMTFGLISVEKNAKRTKDYVQKKDLFKTKELVDTQEVDAELEKAGVVEAMPVAEVSTEHAQALETATQHVLSEHRIARKPVPAPSAATNIEAIPSEPVSHDAVIEMNPIIKETSVISTDPLATETHVSSANISSAIELKMTKKESLFSQVSIMNKKMRGFSSKKDKEGKETTVSVTEIACDVESPVVEADALLSHGVVDKVDGSPVCAEECAA